MILGIYDCSRDVKLYNHALPVMCLRQKRVDIYIYCAVCYGVCACVQAYVYMCAWLCLLKVKLHMCAAQYPQAQCTYACS